MCPEAPELCEPDPAPPSWPHLTQKPEAEFYSVLVTLSSLCSLHIDVGSLQRGGQGKSRALLPVVCKPACGKHASRGEQSGGGPLNSHSKPGTRRRPELFTRLGIFSFNSDSSSEPACVFFFFFCSFPPTMIPVLQMRETETQSG